MIVVDMVEVEEAEEEVKRWISMSSLAQLP